MVGFVENPLPAVGSSHRRPLHAPPTQEFFYHSVSSLRSMTEEDWTFRSAYPYSRAFKNALFLQADCLRLVVGASGGEGLGCDNPTPLVL